MRVLALPPPVLAVQVTEMTEGAAPGRPGGGARPCTGHSWTCALAGSCEVVTDSGISGTSPSQGCWAWKPPCQGSWGAGFHPSPGIPASGPGLPQCTEGAVPWSQPGDLSSPASSAEGQHPAPGAATGRTPTQQTGQHAEALCNPLPAAAPAAAEPPRPCRACLRNGVEPWREAPGTMDQWRLRLALSRTLPLL